MAELILEDTSANLKVRPICKPVVHLKKSRQRIFNESSIDLIYSFGYQSAFGHNLCVLKENIVIIIAGNYLNFLNIDTLSETFLPSVNGSGFTCVTVHISNFFFAAAEKGRKFCINIFTYPALEVSKVLKEESAIMSTCMMQFNSQGDLLVAMSSDPENKIYIWQWEFECVLFISNDSEQPIYSMHFSTQDEDAFITSGKGFVTFWTVNAMRDDRDIISEIFVTFREELFEEAPKLDAYCTVSVSDTFLTATDTGYMLLWDAELLSFSNVTKLVMNEEKPCHDGSINHIIIHKNYIMTLGSDSYIKFWDQDAIFNSENKEESISERNATVSDLRDLEVTAIKDVHLSLLKTFCISKTSNLVYGIISVVKFDYTTYIIQDSNGLLFHVVIFNDLSNISFIKLLSGLGCSIIGLSSCPVYPYVAAASSLGSVVIYDCVVKEVFKFGVFPIPITSILWPSCKVDDINSSLLVGFIDGTLRWIAFANDTENFILKFVIKPHISAIEYLKMNESCSILISQGLDSKLFFYSVNKFLLIPLGFYINHHEIIDFTWLKYTSSDELGDRIYDSDCDEQPDLNETQREVLNKLKYEEKKERRQSRYFELGLSGSDTPPEILSYLPSSSPNHIWLSLGKGDFGYIFEFEFHGIFTNEPSELVPIRALEILTAEIIPVLTMQYSPCGKLIFMGLQDGSLNLCYLENAFMPDSGYEFAKFQIHDPDKGEIKYLKIAPDGSFIVTAGCDGNIFTFSFNMFDYKDIEEYGEKPILTDVTEVEDIAVSGLSLENQLQSEMDAKYHHIRDQTKSALEKLKKDYLKLKDKEFIAYSDSCASSLQKLKELPDELELNPEKFSASQIATEVFMENTSKLIEDISIQFERNVSKSILMHDKYFKFYKSQVEHSKLLLKSEVEKTILSTFRCCKFPSNISNVHLSFYPSMYQHKEEILSEERTEKKIIKEKIKLLEELSAASISIIDYPNDTPISELISKYNQRKGEYIKMLKEHISEYDVLESIIIDDKKYEETAQEIKASQFKFKETSPLERFSSQYLCTYAEKKERIILYYQKAYNFMMFFNHLALDALEWQTQISEMNVIDLKSNTNIIKKQFLDQNRHIYFKFGEKVGDSKMPIKIEWMQTSEDNKFFIDNKIAEKNMTLEIQTENLFEQQKTCDKFLLVLMMAKPKVNCEKKFHDIRFLLKCIELNTFKEDLMQEKKWLKIIKELECMLHEENKELSAIEEKILTLKNERQLGKNEWMNVYNQFCKAIGVKHKHKGYFKQVFKKKIRPDDEKEPYMRHSSSESSESEQNIDSEDDSYNVNPKDVDQDLLKEVMSFQLKRHGIEKKMKKFKRNLQTDTIKQFAMQEKIERVKDALKNAWNELNSILVNRKQRWKNVIWPTVLYPENVHRDFLSKQFISVREQKMSADLEMSFIHEAVIKELKPIYKLISVAMITVIDRVVNEELNDLIDIACVFFPLIDTVAQEVDEYFKKLTCPVVIEDKKETVAVEKKTVNIIQEILSAATEDATENYLLHEKSEVDDDSTEDFAPVKTYLHTVEEGEKFMPLGATSQEKPQKIRKSKYTDPLFVNHKSIQKFWREVSDEFESSSTKETIIRDFDLNGIISRAVPALDNSLFLVETYCSKEDYYMQPFSFNKNTEYRRKTAKNPNLTFFDFMNLLVDLDISEVVEDLISRIIEEEQCSKNEHKFNSKNFPTYPGGGLVLTRNVLLSMKNEDPDSFPYTNFYQEPLLFTEEVLEKPVVTHIVPCHREADLQYGLPEISFADFILSSINDVLAVLKAYNQLKKTTFDCEKQVRLLEKKLLKTRSNHISVEQNLHAVQRERNQEMENKFSRIVNLDHLQDVIENPHLHIKKYESDKKLESLKAALKKLKVLEVNALKTLDKFGYEDTVFCHELLELRHEFKMMNKKYSSQLQNFPKIVKSSSAKGK